MHKPALLRALFIGTALQLTMILVGHLVPGLAQGNFFAIVGTTLGAVTGFLYGRRATEGGMGPTAAAGAIAGGVAGVVGAAASAGLGDVPLTTIGIAGVSTVVTGAIGGVLGRMLGQRS
jgi:hypothetical protein